MSSAFWNIEGKVCGLPWCPLLCSVVLMGKLDQGSLSSQFLRPWLLESFLPNVVIQSPPTQLEGRMQAPVSFFGNHPNPLPPTPLKELLACVQFYFHPPKALIFLLFHSGWCDIIPTKGPSIPKPKPTQRNEAVLWRYLLSFQHPKVPGAKNHNGLATSWNGNGKNSFSSENQVQFLKKT